MSWWHAAIYIVTRYIGEVANLVKLRDDEYQALARLRYLLRVFLRFSEDAARDEGLTPQQHQLLLAIRGFSGGHAPTVGEVADMLQLQQHSVVELVDRAVEAGLVTRAADVSDRRRQHLMLTAEGEGHLARLAPLHQAELRRFRDEINLLLGDDR
jgi:DNA-binding MarR family transcriptional regulator